MCADYTVSPIAEAQVERAFLLVRLAEPAMTIESWRSLCRPGRRVYQDGGAPWPVFAVLAATGPRGYVQGLAVVGMAQPMDHGTRIEVPAFLAVTAVDPDGVARALLRAVVEMCRDGNGEKLRFVVPGIDPATLGALDRAIGAIGREFPGLAIELETLPGPVG